MNLVLFRAYEKDDYICRLAYESFKHYNVGDKFIALAEKGNYKYIKDLEIIHRDSVGNFGGQLGVKGLLKSFQDIEVEDSDSVFLSDSDILLKESIEGFDGLKGAGGYNGIINHISGQLQIMSGKLFNLLKTFTTKDIDIIVFDEMIPMGLNIADDIFISYIAYKYNFKTDFYNKKWLHKKLYEYNDNTNYSVIINELRNK